VLGPAAALLALAVSAAARAGHHHQRTRLRGPFATPAMAAYLSTRSGDITAAAFNLKTGRLFLYNPSLHGDDASIAKVDILATALMRPSNAARRSARCSASSRRGRSRTQSTTTPRICGSSTAATPVSRPSTPASA
jgi:hypothetical protein